MIAIIVASSLIYLFGVAVGNRFLMWGEVKWYERVGVILWPVTLPLYILLQLVVTIFWPDF